MPLNRNPSAPGKLVSDIDEKGCHVCCGSKTEVSELPRHFRFTHKADIDRRDRDVRFVPLD